MALAKQRDDLSQAVIDALVFLSPFMSKKELGTKIGYPDGTMVSMVMRGECMFGLVQTMMLARLASDLGHDALSDKFCGHGKRCLPAPDVETDGCTHDEERTAMQALGEASRASDGQDWQEVYESGAEMVAAGYGLMKEAELRMKGGNAIRIDRGAIPMEAHPQAKFAAPAFTPA